MTVYASLWVISGDEFITHSIFFIPHDFLNYINWFKWVLLNINQFAKFINQIMVVLINTVFLA